MKRILSLLLSVILLLTTIIIAVPVSAEGTVSSPIKATPLTEWTRGENSWQYATSSSVTPLKWLGTQGIKLVPATAYGTTVYEAEKINESKVYAQAKFNEQKAAFTNGTALMFYLELDAGNTFMPYIYSNVGWDIALTMKSGTKYSYATLGSDTWTTVDAVNCTNDETATYAHGIRFENAFKGYVKVELSAFGCVDRPNWSSSFVIKEIRNYIKGVGGDYGNLVMGPFFLITADSASTKIEVPAEYLPTPIEATPLDDWSSVGSASGVNASGRTTPLGFTTAQGIVVSPSSVPKETPESINDIRFWINFNSGVTATHYLIYVDIPSANILQLRHNVGNWTWLQAGTPYQYAAIGDTEWTDATIGEKGIEFTSAFRGYIKLDRSVTNKTTASFTQLLLYFKGLGTGTLADGQTQVNYGNPVVGPIFEVAKDSISTKITVPEAYRPAPIGVTAISDWYHNNYADFSAAGLAGSTWSTYTNAPLDFTSAIGDSINLSNNTVYEFDPVTSSKIRTYITLNKGVDLTVAESLVVYVNIPAANTLLFNFRTDTIGSYVRSMTLKANGTYYLAAKGASEWTPKNAVYSGDTSAANQSYNGGIKFDGAFEGYIKIPITSIGCADETLSSPKKSVASLVNIECKFKGLSNKYGNNAVVGPYFMATNDSSSTELKLNKLNGDINKDSFADYEDLLILRKYLLGNDNAYVNAYGNLNKDENGNIDICDLVYMNNIANDIIFGNNSYYRTGNDGINGQIRSMSAYVYIPENNIKASARGGVILGNYSLSGKCLNFEIHQSGKPRLYSVNGSGKGIDLIFNGDIRTGDYAHLVITVDDVNKKAACYINGSLVEERTFTNDFDISLNELQFMLGGDFRENNTNYLKGKLGEVALFNSTLTADDVSAIYNSNTAADIDSVVALWDVGNSKEAYIIEDESSNSNYLNPYTTFFYNETEDIDRAYSFAVVGDTQSMASSYSGELGTIYDWILENQQSKNIQHVFGLGDIVDNDTSENQWNIAVNAINKMNGKISYSLVRGNHDSNESMNKYFANEAYMSQIDGFYKEGDVNNVYQKFEIGETKYLFMTLEYLADNAEAGSNPGQSLSPEEQDDIIAWAKGVIDANPDYKVIISTHYYINENGSIAEVNDIESEIVAKCPNVFLVLGGHISSDNIVQGTTNTYEANGESYKVTSLLVDPQGSDLSYNGLGMVAMLYFSADGKTMEVEYYSTVRDQYFLRDNQFVISVE